MTSSGVDSFLLFAQNPDGGTPTTIIGAFISVALALVGLVVWLMRHVFLTTIPEQTKVTLAIGENFKAAIATVAASGDVNQAGLRAENKALREHHDAALERVLVMVQQEGTAERKLCADNFTILNNGLLGLTAALREEREAIVAGVNQHTTEACGDYRHDLYDTINAAVMGKELWLAKKAEQEARAKAAAQSQTGAGS